MSAHPRSKLKHDHDDMEPQLAQMLDDKLARWTLGEYRACTLEEAEAGLRKLYGNGTDGVSIGEVRRLSGGSSKEQFVFELRARDKCMPQTLVLRMRSDPATARHRIASLRLAARSKTSSLLGKPRPQGKLFRKSRTLSSIFANGRRCANASGSRAPDSIPIQNRSRR